MSQWFQGAWFRMKCEYGLQWTAEAYWPTACLHAHSCSCVAATAAGMLPQSPFLQLLLPSIVEQ